MHHYVISKIFCLQKHVFDINCQLLHMHLHETMAGIALGYNNQKYIPADKTPCTSSTWLQFPPTANLHTSRLKPRLVILNKKQQTKVHQSFFMSHYIYQSTDGHQRMEIFIMQTLILLNFQDFLKLGLTLLKIYWMQISAVHHFHNFIIQTSLKKFAFFVFQVNSFSHLFLIQSHQNLEHCNYKRHTIRT